MSTKLVFINLKLLKMKKIFIILLAVNALSFSAVAQIPNFDFENWTSHGTYSTPDNWGTMNNTTAVGAVFTATAGTPGATGSSYLKLTSQTVGPSVINGIAVCGILDSMTMAPKSGFAFTGQPQNFTGKWQHMIYGTSQGSVDVKLTKWNNITNQRDIIATAYKALNGMQMNWATFTIPFTYTSSETPDSCIIFMQASGSTPANNDYLWLDDLAFSGSVAGIQENIAVINSTLITPNPVQNVLNLEISSAKNQDITISIVGLDGKIYSNENKIIANGKNNFEFNISSYSKGIYFLKIQANGELRTEKFIVE